MSFPKRVGDLADELGELSGEADLGSRGKSNGTSKVVDDLARAARHDEHLGRQEDRLADRVGDEQAGELLRAVKSLMSSSFRRSRVISSRAPNGSSKRNTSGSSVSERASEARIFMPPESAFG